VKRATRLGALAVVLGVFASVATSGAGFAAGNKASKVVDFKTMYASLRSDGTVDESGLVDNLRVFGQGNVVVTVPMPTKDFRNLGGFSGASAGDGRVTWHVDSLHGSRNFVSVGTPDTAPPIGMNVAYAMDGRSAPGPDLVGRAGHVRIAFTVSNDTARVQKVAYTLPDGTKKTVWLKVPVPMLAQLQLILPQGHFSTVDAPLAAQFNTPTGDLVVQWNLVLAPPLGALTQTYVLTANTTDFEMGPVLVAGTAVVPKGKTFLTYAKDQLAGGANQATTLFDGAQQLGAGMDKLHAGTLKLQDGLERLFAGSGKLTAGLQKAASGSGQLTAGLGRARTGSGKITGGLGQLQSGLGKILGGLQLLASKLPAARDGAQAIADGAAALDAGVAQIQFGLTLFKGCMTGSTCVLVSGTDSLTTLADQVRALAAHVNPQLRRSLLSVVSSRARLSACLSGVTCDGRPSIPSLAVAIERALSDIPSRAEAASSQAGAIAAAAGEVAQKAGDIGAACDPAAYAGCSGIRDQANAIQGLAGGIGGDAAGIRSDAGAISSDVGGVSRDAMAIRSLAASLVLSGVDCLAGGASGCNGRPSATSLLSSIDAASAAATDIASAMDKLAKGVATGLQQALDGIGNPNPKQKTIRGGLAAIQAGALRLAAGVGLALNGLGNTTTGNTLIGGTALGLHGTQLLHAGSQQLTTGLGTAQSGSSRLTAGLGLAASGSGKITNGLGKAKAGGVKIANGVALANKLGVQRIAKGANDTVNQLQGSLSLLRAEEGRAADLPPPYQPPSSDQADTVIGASSVVLSLDALDGRGHDSTIRSLFTLLMIGGLGLLALVGLRARRLAQVVA
jgi:putative membrane protein